MTDVSTSWSASTMGADTAAADGALDKLRARGRFGILPRVASPPPAKTLSPDRFDRLAATYDAHQARIHETLSEPVVGNITKKDLLAALRELQTQAGRARLPIVGSLMQGFAPEERKHVWRALEELCEPFKTPEGFLTKGLISAKGLDRYGVTDLGRVVLETAGKKL